MLSLLLLSITKRDQYVDAGEGLIWVWSVRNSEIWSTMKVRQEQERKELGVMGLQEAVCHFTLGEGSFAFVSQSSGAQWENQLWLNLWCQLKVNQPFQDCSSTLCKLLYRKVIQFLPHLSHLCTQKKHIRSNKRHYTLFYICVCFPLCLKKKPGNVHSCWAIKDSYHDRYHT